MLGHLHLIFKGNTNFPHCECDYFSDFKSSKIKIINYKTITNTIRTDKK